MSTLARRTHAVITDAPPRAEKRIVLEARLVERQRTAVKAERRRVLLFFVLLRVFPSLCFSGAGLLVVHMAMTGVWS